MNIELLVAYCREMGLYKDMMHDLEQEGFTVTVNKSVLRSINPKRKIAESALPLPRFSRRVRHLPGQPSESGCDDCRGAEEG